MSELLCRSVVAGAVGAGLLWAGIAQAQETIKESELEKPPADAVISGVIVTPPKIVETTKFGMHVMDISLSVRVPYGDLDMSTPGGVAELDRRVNEGAEYACRQLELKYPTGSPALRVCQRRAVDDAEPQVVAARAGG